MRELALTLIADFARSYADPDGHATNEATLQHELALYLRTTMPDSWRVELERPVRRFYPAAQKLTKKEIDIVLLDKETGAHMAIELKCPRAGQHPEQMFKACQDIEFLEQLVGLGFCAGAFLMHVCDPLFYSTGAKDGIYSHFRNGAPIHGRIDKPTGPKKWAGTRPSAQIFGSYVPVWTLAPHNHRFWLQAVPAS